MGDGHLENKTLTITGNSLEKEHYDYISKKIKNLFGLKSNIRNLKNQNAMQLRVHSTELIKYLQKNGMVVGNKIKNKASLPKWIFKKERFIYATLRGLFDTDGGVYYKQKKYKRAIIEFQTKSPYIFKDIISLLQKTKFIYSKSSTSSGFVKESFTTNIRIQHQEDVKRFMRLIGSANPKNIIRYEHFIKKGFIPLKERLNKDISSYKRNLPFKAALI